MTGSIFYSSIILPLLILPTSYSIVLSSFFVITKRDNCMHFLYRYTCTLFQPPNVNFCIPPKSESFEFKFLMMSNLVEVDIRTISIILLPLQCTPSLECYFLFKLKTSYFLYEKYIILILYLMFIFSPCKSFENSKHMDISHQESREYVRIF